MDSDVDDAELPREVCCGWVNRGLAMGEGLLYFGQLDANVVALDMKTGTGTIRAKFEGLTTRRELEAAVGHMLRAE